MTDLPPDPVRIRTDLAGSVQDIGRLFMRREAAIVAARRAGIPVKEIRSLAVEPVARTADEVIMGYDKERKASAFAATADLWKTGQVVEDRYGLRWRADTSMSNGQQGWFCRSVGLRVFLDGERMAQRGPLTLIRQDQVFAGKSGSEERAAARAAREAGEAEDQAVTVTPGEDPEWIPVRFPVLLVEGLTTIDGRIIDAGGIVPGSFPLTLSTYQDGQTVPVGRIDTLNRTIGAVRKRDGTPFPSSVAVWSGTGAVYGFTRAEVADMTRQLFPEADLTDVEVSDAEVGDFIRITSGVLKAVVLGERPAFEDAYWTLQVPGSETSWVVGEPPPVTVKMPPARRFRTWSDSDTSPRPRRWYVCSAHAAQLVRFHRSVGVDARAYRYRRFRGTQPRPTPPVLLSGY